MSHVVVDEARRWIGTPYFHQASRLGAGTDCLGLVRGVWRALYGSEPEALPAYSPDWDEVAGREVLGAAADRCLMPAMGLAPGRVILFRMRKGAVAKHLGILAIAGDQPTFIHAYNGHGVVETTLSLPWRRRIAALYAFPDHH